MKLAESIQPENPNRPDDLDELLRSFFRAEMPAPWPTMKAPASAERASAGPSWWSRSRSRLALAASIALLALASLWMSARTADYATPLPGFNRDLPGDANDKPGRSVRKAVKENETPKDKTAPMPMP
jgi:hypothetical protein